MGCARTLLVDLNARAGVHQLALAHLDVEPATGWIACALKGHLDAVGGSRSVGTWEVVRNGDAAHVAVAAAP